MLSKQDVTVHYFKPVVVDKLHVDNHWRKNTVRICANSKVEKYADLVLDDRDSIKRNLDFLFFMYSDPFKNWALQDFGVLWWSRSDGG